MTSDREGHFLWLAEALTRFKATEAEVLAHCKAGRIAAVYVSEEGPNGIRVCVEDMRKLFEETGDPEETNKRSAFGKVVRGTAVVAGAAAVEKLVEVAWPAIGQAWSFLAEHVFRSLPAPVPREAQDAARLPSSRMPSDRAMSPGRDYVTREEPGPGTRTTGLGGRAGPTPGTSGAPGGDSRGGYTTRDGGAGSGWRTR